VLAEDADDRAQLVQRLVGRLLDRDQRGGGSSKNACGSRATCTTRWRMR